MKIAWEGAALVATDPQSYVLSERGAAWGSVGESVRQNNTGQHLEQLFKPVKAHRYDVSSRTRCSARRTRLRP
jgi:hypothetical protein